MGKKVKLSFEFLLLFCLLDLKDILSVLSSLSCGLLISYAAKTVKINPRIFAVCLNK